MPRSRDAHFVSPRATQPLPVRIANDLAGPFTRRIDLSGEALAKRALRGLGPEAESALEFREALEALGHSMAHETRLHALGRITARDDTARLARTQVRVNLELRRRPEILETKLPRPIYVIGWPRTGSTLLHTLLAQDPAHRALLYYEGFDPAAPGQAGDDRRREKLGKLLKGLEFMAPGYRAIHAMEPDSVEECVTVMYHTFSTPQMEFQYRCPSYLAFLERQGTRAPYEHYRKQLQMLHFYRPHGERWVLKDPAHLLALDTLQELFPDAAFVWIHRDPVRSLASIASLTAHTRALFSYAYGTEEVGKEVLAGVWPRALRRGLELREKLPPERVVDVRYADLMAEPLETLAGIYRGLGLELTGEARRAMQQYLSDHPRGSEGVHRYSPELFGMDVATLRAEYRDYCERFDVPAEA